MQNNDQPTIIYTIIYTAADADRGNFHSPEARGRYLSLASAHAELERQIAEEKAALDSRYDCEERDEDSWETYQDGYGAACFSRIEILADALHRERGIKMRTANSSLSVEERNQTVLAYLWCIDAVIRQNYSLVQAAHLDRDDVYQSLALRLIQAVERYRPGARSLKGYIFSQLKYELLNCKSAKARYGLGAAPYDLRGAVVSMEEVGDENCRSCAWA